MVWKYTLTIGHVDADNSLAFDKSVGKLEQLLLAFPTHIKPTSTSIKIAWISSIYLYVVYKSDEVAL